MKIVIVDDIFEHIEDLKAKLLSIGNYEIVIFTQPLDAYQYLSEKKADLLFLDIDMPSLSGFKLLDMLNNPPPTVFVSSHPEFAVESFDYKPLYFVQKPVRIEKLLKAINLALELDSILEDHCYVREDGKNVKLFYNSITYIAANKDYVNIFKADNSSHMVLSTLRNFLRQLPTDLFIRVNKSTAVNLEKVTAYNNQDIFINEKELAIGTGYMEGVIQQLSSRAKVIERKVL